MKNSWNVHSTGVALLLLALLAATCLAPTAARAQINLITKAVNCDDPPTGDFPTIQQALNNLDWNGPIEIVVTGTCYGRINIGDGVFHRNSVYIHPPEGQRATITPPSGTGTVVSIGAADGIWIERLDIRGGSSGVLVYDASEVDFSDVTIENNTGNGVSVYGNSIVYFQASRIRNNGIVGVDLSGQGANTASFLRTNVIEGNGWLGVNAGLLAAVHFSGPNIVRNNGGATSATAHGGIRVIRNSAVLIQANTAGSTEIASNVGPGILAEVGSSVTLLGANIHNNTEQGVRARTQSVVHLVGGNTFTSNGLAHITCDVWSLLTGDLSGIDPIDCKNVDVPNKK